jgi:hypothetical protein
MEKPSQMEIQNALRILTHVVRPGEMLDFHGGDMISLSNDNIDWTMERTQDMAETLYSRG